MLGNIYHSKVIMSHQHITHMMISHAADFDDTNGGDGELQLWTIETSKYIFEIEHKHHPNTYTEQQIDLNSTILHKQKHNSVPKHIHTHNYTHAPFCFLSL